MPFYQRIWMEILHGEYCCVEKFVKFLIKWWTKWSFWKSLTCRLKTKIMSAFKFKIRYILIFSAFNQFSSAYTCFVIIRYNLQIYKEEHGWTTIAVGLFCNSIKNCDDSRKHILTTYFESWGHWTFLTTFFVEFPTHIFWPKLMTSILISSKLFTLFNMNSITFSLFHIYASYRLDDKCVLRTHVRSSGKI